MKVSTAAVTGAAVTGAATRLAGDAASEPAVRQAAEALVARLGQRPDLVFVAYTALQDAGAVQRAVTGAFPGVPVLGASSCRGFLTDEGVFGFGAPAIGLLGVADPGGAFGTAVLPKGGDPAGATRTAITQAQARAGRVGEHPALVWLAGTPGAEEAVVEAVRATLGQQVQISGGSCGDETIAGGWSVFDAEGTEADGIGLALFYPEAEVRHHFRAGYVPTDRAGLVTAAEGRILREIDGQPAAQVYNGWTEGVIDAALADPSLSILGATSWRPLGRRIGHIGPNPDLSVPYYCLLHPDKVTPEDGLSLFAAVRAGETLTLMQSGPEALIERAAQVVSSSLEPSGGFAGRPQGALMIFCAGCMLALGEDIHRAAAAIRASYGATPFLCSFTFGEQGGFLNGERQHGNLMISSSVLAA